MDYFRRNIIGYNHVRLTDFISFLFIEFPFNHSSCFRIKAIFLVVIYWAKIVTLKKPASHHDFQNLLNTYS